MLCDSHCYVMTEQDFEVLARVSPGYARLARDCDGGKPTHFVCEHCGQIPPLKLRPLHNCRNQQG